jgi:hypothetical protein
MVTFMLLAFVLAGMVFHNQQGRGSHGGNPMEVTRITVEHVRIVADQARLGCEA